jgi:predicted ATP-dependent Lon-type protease
MSELDRKAATIFAGKVVRKDLVRKVKVGANVPGLCSRIPARQVLCY